MKPQAIQLYTNVKLQKKKKKKNYEQCISGTKIKHTIYIYIYIWRLSNFTCPLPVLRVYHMA